MSEASTPGTQREYRLDYCGPMPRHGESALALAPPRTGSARGAPPAPDFRPARSGGRAAVNRRRWRGSPSAGLQAGALWGPRRRKPTALGGTTQRRTSGRRAPGVRALAVLLLALGLGNLAKAAIAARYAALLPDLAMTVSWAYLAAMGAFWGVSFITCVVGLMWFRSWSRVATLAVATLYQAHVWANHLLLDVSDYALQTRPRDLVFSLLFLSLVWASLNWPSIREVFRR